MVFDNISVKTREYNRKYSSEYRTKNKIRIRAKAHEYHVKNKDRINAKAREYRARNKKYFSEYRSNNKDQLRAKDREKRAALWAQFLELYGKECACCHEKDPKFLTVGHKLNDGRADRLTHGQGWGILRYAIKHPDFTKYETQCYNCNCGAARNGGICPHKTHTATPQ